MTFMLKKPSELKSFQPTPVEYTYANGNGIACFCPDCGAETEFHNEWPIDIPITCGDIQDDGSVCNCRFIIKNDTPIEE